MRLLCSLLVFSTCLSFEIIIYCYRADNLKCPNFTTIVCQLFMDNSKDLEILCKLGQGAYGAVHKARIVKTGEIVAVKTVKLTDEDEGITSTTIRELTILQNLNHPNIIKLTDSRLLMTGLNPRIQLIFEFMDEDLGKMLRKVKTIDPTTVKSIMYQILTGVKYMHSKKVFHRDLKPQNILINTAGNVKIADFGLGRIFGERFTTMSKEIQTLWYRSPELLLGTTRYDLSVDVWSIGCVFYEIAEGKVLFQTESQIGQIFEIMRQQGTPQTSQWKEITNLPFFKPTFPKFKKAKRQYSNLSFEGIDLLEKLIMVNPQKRITITEALEHRYFNN